jgi:hypothetical protein
MLVACYDWLMMTLPFKSFSDVSDLDWSLEDAVVLCSIRGHQNKVCIPLANIEAVYPHFQQAMRYLEGNGTSRSQYWKRLLLWEGSALRLKTPVVLTVTGGSHAVGAIASMRFDAPSSSIESDTGFGITWRLRLVEWEMQFPGFSNLFAACEALTIGPRATAHTMVEWLLEREKPEPLVTLPADLVTV